MEPITQTQIDWKLLRFQYEVLGISLQQLADEHPCTNIGLIEDAAAEQGWKSSNLDALVPVLSNSPDTLNSAEQFAETTKSFLVGANLVKQRALFPEFARCEAVLLSKLTQAALSIDPSDEKACTRLTNLVKSLQGLLNNNNFLTATVGDGEGAVGGNGFTIQIMQQVN